MTPFDRQRLLWHYPASCYRGVRGVDVNHCRGLALETVQLSMPLPTAHLPFLVEVQSDGPFLSRGFVIHIAYKLAVGQPYHGLRFPAFGFCRTVCFIKPGICKQHRSVFRIYIVIQWDTVRFLTGLKINLRLDVVI